MAITNTTLASPTYSGNGATTAFATGFYFIANSHLEVIVTSSAGVETVKTITTDYTVTGAGLSGGGTVTFLVAPATGEKVNIKSKVPYTQETDYLEGGSFAASTHENALDKLTKLAQQNQELTNRSLKLPISNQSVTTQTNTVAPGNVLRVSTDGTKVEWVSPFSAGLSGDLTPTDGGFVVGNGTGFSVETGATARTSMGLGTLATQSDSSVNITGGAIVGITDLAIADGGTGASNASDARTNLGLGTLATQSGTFSGTSSGTNTGDQNLFSTIVVSGQDDVVADSTSDTLTLVAGSNVTITTNAGTDTITISATGGGGGGGGDVTGPGSSTDGELPLFNGTGGDTLKRSNTLNGAVTLSSGVVSAGTLGVANGGTGVTSTTEYAVLCGGTTSTGALQPVASVGTSGQILTSNGAGALPTFQTLAGGTAATQSDQETATSTTTYVSPGRQQFHPSAAKAWAYVTVSGGTPTLQVNYNITSITDSGVGILDITINQDFSTANYVVLHDVSIATPGSVGGYFSTETSGSRAVGGVQIYCFRHESSVLDPASYSVGFFGDQ